MRLAGLALALSVVFAMPLASAFGMGVDAASVSTMKNAGATPKYGQVWVGHWMQEYGWGGMESELTKLRDQGVTPVLMWYYWGDDISPNCVKYGCAGRTKAEWDSMAKTMASKAKSILGTRQFYVVLEPEFQKNGIEDWDTFDGYLRDQANMVRYAAPSADIVIGFGHWGEWDLFDRAVGAADLVGFQVLRGSTRDSTTAALDTADYIIEKTKALKSRWGKEVMVFDLGIATYGGWNWVQEQALQNIIDKRSALDAAGVKAIIWRYVYDNDHSSGYFGAAESTWGVKYAGGGNKPAYDEIVTLLKGSSTTSTTSSSTSSTSSSATSTTSSSSSTGSVFSSVSGNQYWVQAKVANSPTKVELRVNGGSWMSMTYRSWGSWAASPNAPSGSVVELRATFSGGSTASAAYLWPSATPTSATTGTTTSTSTSTPTSSGSFDATFGSVKLEEWWVQVDVDSGSSVRAVEARVNGGSWKPLSLKSWGDWAASINVPYGAKVEFRATSSTGVTDVSGAFYRR